MDKTRDILIRKMLSDNGLGALFLWRSDELVMATGYQPLWGVSVCLYPAIGIPIIYVPGLEPKDILPDGFKIKTFPWGRLDYRNPWDILYETIKEDLIKLCINNQPVTFIQHSSHSAPSQMSAESAPLPFDFQKRIKYLSKGGYKDFMVEILQLYTIKTPEEISKISLTNQVASIGIKAFYANLIPGKTEAEVACAVESAVQSQIGKAGVIYAKSWPLIMSGINSAYGGTFNRTTGKVLQSDELVLIEMAVCVNGYWCDITRTGSIGTISKKQQTICDIVKTAQEIGFQAIKPGVKASTIDRIVREYIDNMGYSIHFQHALGHHVGFRYHDPGQGLSPESELVIAEGMVLTVEPGIYALEFGGGSRIEDNVLVTMNGIKILSEDSSELNDF